MERAYLCLNYLIHQTACVLLNLSTTFSHPRISAPKPMVCIKGIKWQVHVHPLTISSHNDIFRTKIKNEASQILLNHSLYSYSDDHTWLFPSLLWTMNFFIAAIKGAMDRKYIHIHNMPRVSPDQCMWSWLGHWLVLHTYKSGASEDDTPIIDIGKEWLATRIRSIYSHICLKYTATHIQLPWTLMAGGQESN